jgi:hypothetical protein
MSTHDHASGITLTRAEACAVSSGLIYTGGCLLEYADTRDGCQGAIRRLQLEGNIRDAGSWWGEPPHMLDMYERLGEGTCPDSFAMAAEGVDAIVELLPALLEEVEDLAPTRLCDFEGYETFRDALRGLACRLVATAAQAGATA